MVYLCSSQNYLDMIEPLGKYYLYRHIRLDKNEPFYIGIGTKSFFKKGKNRTLYVRGYSKLGRNRIWKGIVSRTKYEVEILFESNNYNFIFEKEKEFISLYGRIDLGAGTLANLNIGGNGGHIHTPQHKTRKGHRYSEEEKRRRRETHYHNKKVYQYDLEGNFIREWNSVVQASLGLLNKNNPHLNGVARGRCNHKYKNFYWSYEKFEFFKPEPKEKKSGRENQLKTFKKTHPQLQLTDKFTGETIVWNSLIEFIEQNPEFSKYGIYRCLGGGRKYYKGYSYKYIPKDNVKSKDK